MYDRYQVRVIDYLYAREDYVKQEPVTCFNSFLIHIHTYVSK